MIPDDEFIRRRKSRSIVMAVMLIALAVLFFFMTIAKITG